jgi:hypothetical protein
MYKLFEITTCCGGQRNSQGERAREIEGFIILNRKAAWGKQAGSREVIINDDK